MSGIGRHWNGHIYGTNTGNIAVTLEQVQEGVTGTLRLADNQFGVVVYGVQGTFVDGKLALTGAPQGELPEGIAMGELAVVGALTADGRLEGEWSTTIGTGGTFQLWPHNAPAKTLSTSNLPEQANISTRSLGAVRLYADDVRRLIAQLVKDFAQKRAVVTYNDKGNEKNLYSDDFEALLDDLPQLHYLKISVQEPEMYGINRLAMIELSAWGENIIRVQSVQESWAIGKAEALSRQVNSFQRKLATGFQKYGGFVNVVITIVALAALPSLVGFWRRLAFAGAIFGIQTLIAFLHRKYVPNFRLFPKKQKPTLMERLGPGVASWAITIVGAVIGAVIYGLLKGELANSPLMNTIQAVIGAS